MDHVSVPTAMRKRSPFLFYWGPFLAFASAILLFSSVPRLPEVPRGSDKVLHFLEYAVFAFLFWRALVKKDLFSFRWASFLPVVLISPGFAALDELYQSTVPGRHASFSDWWADVAGIFALITLILIGGRWRTRAGYET